MNRQNLCSCCWYLWLVLYTRNYNPKHVLHFHIWSSLCKPFQILSLVFILKCIIIHFSFVTKVMILFLSIWTASFKNKINNHIYNIKLILIPFNCFAKGFFILVINSNTPINNATGSIINSQICWNDHNIVVPINVLLVSFIVQYEFLQSIYLLATYIKL